MKKHVLSALFLSSLLLLQSCGLIVINNVGGKDTETTAEATETEPAGTDSPTEIIIDKQTSDNMKKQAEELLSSLKTTDLNGARFLIAAVDDTFYGGDGSLTTLTSDRVLRSKNVAEKLKADITVLKLSDDELTAKLTAAKEKGEYFADVLAVPARLAGKLISDGLVKSIRTVPETDLRAAYLYEDATNAFSAGHGLYAVAGEGCFEPEKMYCVYFNRELAKNLGLDMYKLVSDGEWTLSKYAELSRGLPDGVSHVVLNEKEDYRRMLLLGSGYDFTDNGFDKTPSPRTFSDEYKALTELISALPAPAAVSDATDTFLSGSALFYIDTVHNAAKAADSKTVWGMLPFPKYDGSAEYKTYISPEATVLCIPVGAADDKSSGDFIEAFNAASSYYFKYDYIYYNMLEVLRDNGSVNSLNIIINSPNYDFVTAAGSGYPTLYNNTAAAFDKITSGGMSFDEYKAIEPEVMEYLDKWFPITNK